MEYISEYLRLTTFMRNFRDLLTVIASSPLLKTIFNHIFLFTFSHFSQHPTPSRIEMMRMFIGELFQNTGYTNDARTRALASWTAGVGLPYYVASVRAVYASTRSSVK